MKTQFPSSIKFSSYEIYEVIPLLSKVLPTKLIPFETNVTAFLSNDFVPSILNIDTPLLTQKDLG